MTHALFSDVQSSSGFQAASLARRGFLVHAGRGVLAVAVLGLAGCATDDEAGPAPAPARSGFAAGLAWYRVDLAYVSAYVLVRGRQAAVVDTGYGGSADRIGAALEAAGTGWDGVRHVLVTHAHYDHAEGLADVAERATGATLYAGAADLDVIASPPPGPPGSPAQGTPAARRIRAVTDGEDVFGLQVVTTPGHTLGHIAVFDADSSVLVAGDALTNTVDGMLAGALPVVTVDPAAAADSVRKLAALDPRVILVGHGPPVERDAAAKLWRLASTLN
jgi:glyoxylase-like metal-dependent hydrolase (beta-lactamase superfamily II)